MAVPVGAGFETVHGHHFEDIDNVQSLILGLQYHVYIVTLINVHCVAVDDITDVAFVYLTGYDSHAGVAGQVMNIFQTNLNAAQTFVWNNKFAFNGTEPNSTAVMSAAVQALIAAQGTSTVQSLAFDCTSSDDGGQNYDVMVSYIDQNFS
jgi:hypothetical protein